MGYEIMETVFKEPFAGVCVVAIVVTIVALAASTRYSIRNLFNIRSSTCCQRGRGVNLSGDTRESSTGSNSCDGNDGDDEGEGDIDRAPNAPPEVSSPRYPDPVDYCEHIQGEIKRVQQTVATKSIADSLTEDQLNEEREIQRQQLADIFRVMQEQQDRFGIGTLDDMQEQMKLYAM